MSRSLRTVQVPLTEVAAIHLRWPLGRPRIVVMLGGATPLGRRIVFEPTMDWMATAYERRVARQLRELVATAKDAAGH